MSIYNKFDTSNEYYCMVGNEDFIDDNKRPRIEQDGASVMAKRSLKSNGSLRLQIRIDKYKKLYNPNGIMASEITNKDIHRIKEDIDSFTDVGIKTFDLYLSFLKTNNPNFLRQAERELG